MNRFEKYGFTIDRDKLEINRVFSAGKFSTIYLDTYSMEPYMLFSRVSENNVKSVIDDGRIVMRKSGRYETAIMDILLDDIDGCMFKYHGCFRVNEEMRVEFVFTVHDICFRMIVII